MIYYLFILLELLAIEVGSFSYEIGLIQYPTAFLIGYYTSINPSRNNINSLLVMVIFSISCIICGYFNIYHPYIIIILSVWFLSFQRYKSYKIISDEYNHKNVMLAFYRPNTLRGYLLSLFGQDVSSMSVIVDGTWARFKWSKPRLIMHDYKESHSDKYVLIDTGIETTDKIKDIFYGLRNAPARTINSLYLRFNCVRTFSPLLYELGSKWEYRWFDFIPSFFLRRRGLLM